MKEINTRDVDHQDGAELRDLTDRPIFPEASGEASAPPTLSSTNGGGVGYGNFDGSRLCKFIINLKCLSFMSFMDAYRINFFKSILKCTTNLTDKFIVYFRQDI